MIDELLTLTFIVSTVTFTVWGVIALLPDRRRRADRYPSMSVIMPAHNEESCIASTVESVLAVKYPSDVEVVVVNDGSSDRTGEIVAQIAAKNPQVKLIETDHVGKALAVNRGVEASCGEIVVMLDADSKLAENALIRFAETLSDPSVAAASGVIRVVVNRNPLVWCQEIEYIYSSMWRYIFDKIGCTYVLPGFAAFKRNALKEVGCFSTDTLSEDCDVGLKLRKRGWRLAMADAVMYTNVPQTLQGVAKQRIRWGRGTVQVLRKHRDMILNPRYGVIGMYGLPNNIYFFIQGIIILPINLYQILHGYFEYFASHGNYLSLNVIKYLFDWFTAFGAVQFIYNVLAGIWEMPGNFHYFLASYIVTQSYALLAAKKITGLNIRILFVLCFFFPYYLYTMLFFIYPIFLELNPLTQLKGHINIWEKNR